MRDWRWRWRRWRMEPRRCCSRRECRRESLASCDMLASRRLRRWWKMRKDDRFGRTIGVLRGEAFEILKRSNMEDTEKSRRSRRKKNNYHRDAEDAGKGNSESAACVASWQAGAQPFEPALPVLRMNRAAARFTSSAPTVAMRCIGARGCDGGLKTAATNAIQVRIDFPALCSENVASLWFMERR